MEDGRDIPEGIDWENVYKIGQMADMREARRGVKLCAKLLVMFFNDLPDDSRGWQREALQDLVYILGRHSIVNLDELRGQIEDFQASEAHFDKRTRHEWSAEDDEES